MPGMAIPEREQRAAIPEHGQRAVILVEGASDRAAVQAVAQLRGVDLPAHRVEVVAMGGVTNIGHYLRRYGPGGAGPTLAGLCDAGEAAYVARALVRAGICAAATENAMREQGFYVCHRDLEDELIRAVGVDGVQAVIADEGELRSWRTLQRQPAQRDRDAADQLRRFFGGRSGNKHRYARLLAYALDPTRVPPPLAGVVDHVTAVARPGADATGRGRTQA